MIGDVDYQIKQSSSFMLHRFRENIQSSWIKGHHTSSPYKIELPPTDYNNREYTVCTQWERGQLITCFKGISLQLIALKLEVASVIFVNMKLVEIPSFLKLPYEQKLQTLPLK